MYPSTFSTADTLLDDFLVAENAPHQSEIKSLVLTAERASPITSPNRNQSNINYDGKSPDLGDGSHIHPSGSLGYFIYSLFLEFCALNMLILGCFLFMNA